GRGGPVTRLAVARDGAVVLDVALPGRPARDEMTYGPAPLLAPIVRAARTPSPYVLIDIDRAGADIDVVDALGREVAGRQVEGSQDVLHKVPGGGWSHRRIQSRAQDSWDRNAAEVAAEVDRIVAEVSPE